MERKLIVITGGPGVGKTTLLNCLNNKGFITVPEDARQIIKEQMEVNGEALPWKNKTFYAELMLKASVDSYKKVVPSWEEIYETDSERKQTWEEAVFTFEKMKETYLKFGYNIIEVPKCGVEERAKFVLDSIK